jgi:hypothetical protein
MAQKTLITIIQAAMAELNLPRPLIAVSSSDQNVIKMVALLRAVCDDLLVEYDWQCLQTRYSFSTTGVESYALPTGLDRFISGTFFDANNRWPMKGPRTPTEWEWIKASNFNGGPFTSFRVYGNQFYITPVPTSTYTFNLEYTTSYYVIDGSSGVSKADFESDSDIAAFDHRVLIYGLKLKWRESIGQDTTTALSDYSRALEFARGSDQPSAKLNLLGSTGYHMLGTSNIPDGSWSV